MKRFSRSIFVVIIFVLCLTGCKNQSKTTDEPQNTENGDVVTITEQPVIDVTDNDLPTPSETDSNIDNSTAATGIDKTGSPSASVTATAATATLASNTSSATQSASVTATKKATAKATSTAAVTSTSKPTVTAKNSSAAVTTIKPTVSSTTKPTVKPTATPVKGENKVLPSNPNESQIIEYLGLENVGREISNDAFDEIAKKTGGKTLYIKDYGAKGDGVTNDKALIEKAISDLAAAPTGSVLEFEANKTYYCGNSSAALKLNSLSNKIIRGKNTTILIDAPAKYIDMSSCRNFAIQGLNFNYKTKPYAFTKTVDKVTNGPNEYSIEVTLDRSLGINKTFTASGLEFFGVLNRDNGRYHMSINKIVVIDANAYKYRIVFNNTSVFHPIDDSLKHVTSMGMIVPVPNIGHSVEQAFTILNNTNVILKDCNVYSACKFMFFMRGNSDKVVFENFNVIPDPAEYNGNIRIVGWRDGFHCKENRAQLIWKDCTLEWVYDDMFNISCTMTKIDDLTETADGPYFTLFCPETNSIYTYPKKGDKVTIYNSTNGKIVGVSKIKKVLSKKIYLEDEIEGLKNGLYVSVDSLAAPNSQIINCEIKGTLRFRTPMFIADSKIHVTRMWLAFELAGGRYLEGPVAKNILFSNCKFTFDNASEKFIEIFSSNTASTKALKTDNTNQDQYYHVKDIIFYKSVINPAQILYKNAELYCDDVVKFFSCTK